MACTALHCTALHCSALHSTPLHSTALHCTPLHCTALHCTALHCTAHERETDCCPLVFWLVACGSLNTPHATRQSQQLPNIPSLMYFSTPAPHTPQHHHHHQNLAANDDNTALKINNHHHHHHHHHKLTVNDDNRCRTSPRSSTSAGAIPASPTSPPRHVDNRSVHVCFVSMYVCV
jgi:hypothetical protein